MAEPQSGGVCCTTPRAFGFWLAVFLLLAGGAFLLVQVWPGLGDYRGALLFGAAGVACVANFAVNRSFHCALTGPFLLLVAAVLALGTAGVWELRLPTLWPVVLIVIGVSLLLERRFAR